MSQNPLVSFGSNNTMYLKVYDGTLIQDMGQNPERKENDGLEIRPHKTLGQIYFRRIRNVEGYIVDLKLTRNPIKIGEGEIILENLDLTIGDKPDKSDCSALVSIQFIWGSRPANSVMYCMHNVNVKAPIRCWAKDWMGKTYFTIVQQNDKGEWKIVKSYWTKEDGMVPPLELKKIRGKDVWDNTDQIEFFENELEKFRQANFVVESAKTDYAPTSKARKTSALNMDTDQSIFNESVPMSDIVLKNAKEDKGSGDPDLDALLATPPPAAKGKKK